MPDGSDMRGRPHGGGGTPGGGRPGGRPPGGGGFPGGGGPPGGGRPGGFPGFRRFPRFFFFPVPYPSPGCYYIDRYGRCCDRYGWCCDRYGRCGYDEFYGGY
jgi:hypothetical protein